MNATIKTFPIVLSIAGSDSSGGAGIQADIKTITALGAYATTVITAVTAQNTTGVFHIEPLSLSSIEQQFRAVMDDLHPTTIKIGMLNDVSIISCISKLLREYKPQHLVIDPVMVSAGGDKLICDDALHALTELLSPLATIITPNTEEGEILANSSIHSLLEMNDALHCIKKYTPGAILLKGKKSNDDTITDLLYLPNKSTISLTEQYIPTTNVHGAGCTLSSAIATYLELGFPLETAVRKAKYYVRSAIVNACDIHVGSGIGPLCHSYSPQAMHIIEKSEK